MGSGDSLSHSWKPSFGQQRREGSLGDGPKVQRRRCGATSSSHHIWELFQVGISQNLAGIPGKISGPVDQSLHVRVLLSAVGFQGRKWISTFSRGRLATESSTGKFWQLLVGLSSLPYRISVHSNSMEKWVGLTSGEGKQDWLCPGQKILCNPGLLPVRSLELEFCWKYIQWINSDHWVLIQNLSSKDSRTSYH